MLLKLKHNFFKTGNWRHFSKEDTAFTIDQEKMLVISEYWGNTNLNNELSLHYHYFNYPLK